MEINNLNQRLNLVENVKVNASFLLFEKLLDELRKRELPDSIVKAINEEVDDINSISDSEKNFKKKIIEKRTRIIKLLEKELKLVPKNYYRNTWMAVGMAAFGVPLGVVFGVSQGNMAFLGIGIPLGMVIGMALGAGMDKKALQEGRQLDIEIGL